jgi:hypothetical protein
VHLMNPRVFCWEDRIHHPSWTHSHHASADISDIRAINNFNIFLRLIKIVILLDCGCTGAVVATQNSKRNHDSELEAGDPIYDNDHGEADS